MDQTSRLYRAEYVLLGCREMTIPECKSYVEKVLRSAWTQNHFPLAETQLAKVKVTSTTRYSSYADQQAGKITLARWTRNRYFILHEVAHLLTPMSYSPHGKVFAATLLKLVRYWLDSKRYYRLKRSFRALGVVYE
jgi:putative metallohydrolase (TIGR04338 family)